jgi:hypothetical protein
MTSGDTPDTRVDVSVSLVRELLAGQFPAWADLPIECVQPNGHDNRTFRLGPEMSVRLPSHERYAAQVEMEQEWLPQLAPLLPIPIPVPLAIGVPGDGYPWHWSVYQDTQPDTRSGHPWSARRNVVLSPPACRTAPPGVCLGLGPRRPGGAVIPARSSPRSEARFLGWSVS